MKNGTTTMLTIFLSNYSFVKGDLDVFPIYKRTEEEGVIEENPGIIADREDEDNLFYDVSGASEKFLADNIDIIEQMNIEHIKRILKDDKNVSYYLVDVTSPSYKELSQVEKDQLGYEFYTTINNQDGSCSIRPILTMNDNFSNLYLHVNPATLSKEVYGKIAGNVEVLLKVGNDKYSVANKNQNFQY